MGYERELDEAIRAAFEAGEKILEIYKNDFSVYEKDDKSPVTEADLMANQVILNRLTAAFPNDGFLSEEAVDDLSRFHRKRCWVIDPLDGTKEFVKKNGEFSVSIGLVDDGEVVMGVIYIPVRKRLYFATRGKGAFRREADGQSTMLSVSTRRKPYHLLVSRSHPSKKTLALLEREAQDILSVTEMGSAIKGCLIAEGLFDVYYNFGHSMKWDTCAMECIVHEAGGIMRRLDDKNIDYMEKSTKNYGFYIINCLENRIDLTDLT